MNIVFLCGIDGSAVVEQVCITRTEFQRLCEVVDGEGVLYLTLGTLRLVEAVHHSLTDATMPVGKHVGGVGLYEYRHIAYRRVEVLHGGVEYGAVEDECPTLADVRKSLNLVGEVIDDVVYVLEVFLVELTTAPIDVNGALASFVERFDVAVEERDVVNTLV